MHKKDYVKRTKRKKSQYPKPFDFIRDFYHNGGIIAIQGLET
jgi:hypothetical protein